MQMVDADEWDLTGMRDQARAAKLMSPPSGTDLIDIVAHEALEAANQGQGAWRWQDGQSMAGHSRAIASFPLRCAHSTPFSTVAAAIGLNTISLA
jgi:hypothetical protein